MLILVCEKTGREFPGHASHAAADRAATHLGLKDYTVQRARRPATAGERP